MKKINKINRVITLPPSTDAKLDKIEACRKANLAARKATLRASFSKIVNMMDDYYKGDILKFEARMEDRLHNYMLEELAHRKVVERKSGTPVNPETERTILIALLNEFGYVNVKKGSK